MVSGSKKKVKKQPEVAVIPEVPVAPKDNKSTFDEIVGNPEMLQTLKEVLSERGYLVVTVDQLAKEMATQRIVTGNEARFVVKRLMSKIIGTEMKEE
jgi:hypothetical protein